MYLTRSTERDVSLRVLSGEIKIDKAIRPYVHELNRIEGVITTECCQGHPEQHAVAFEKGPYLSIRVARWLEGSFDRVIPRLVKECTVAVVEKVFEPARIRYVFWPPQSGQKVFYARLISLLKRLSSRAKKPARWKPVGSAT